MVAVQSANTVLEVWKVLFIICNSRIERLSGTWKLNDLFVKDKEGV
jgi:hypothetical protein